MRATFVAPLVLACALAGWSPGAWAASDHPSLSRLTHARRMQCRAEGQKHGLSMGPLRHYARVCVRQSLSKCRQSLPLVPPGAGRAAAMRKCLADLRHFPPVPR
ncbi:hypothetical protein SLNSH_23740 [Alsobacter soli]|uniref:UrcA family protein n=1 Tax=Alsobacter soli TaxID=2109933 RepID=A0A2T1HLH2_9HYPH|nr:hypothetical protein [Alsobacter soli]PSC02505.1 hypothetical protein SLNSH_23740 [Alsobacter soli]